MSRTWEEGVKDAARIVQDMVRTKKALHHPPQTSVPPVVFVMLNEVELHLAAMLSRGSYESHDTLMQGQSPECCVKCAKPYTAQDIDGGRCLGCGTMICAEVKD